MGNPVPHHELIVRLILNVLLCLFHLFPLEHVLRICHCYLLGNIKKLYLTFNHILTKGIVILEPFTLVFVDMFLNLQLSNLLLYDIKQRENLSRKINF